MKYLSRFYCRGLKFCLNMVLLASNRFGFRPKISCVHVIAIIKEYFVAVIADKTTMQAGFFSLKQSFRYNRSFIPF